MDNPFRKNILEFIVRGRRRRPEPISILSVAFSCIGLSLCYFSSLCSEGIFDSFQLPLIKQQRVLQFRKLTGI